MEAVIQYPGFADQSLQIIGEARGFIDLSDGRFLYEVGTARPSKDGVTLVRHSIAADGLTHLTSRLASRGVGTVLYVHLVGRSPGLEAVKDE